jgi:hypothetical protein
LTASGFYPKEPNGPEVPWIVTDFVPGRPLSEIPEYLKILTGPRNVCTKFIERIYELLADAAEKFEKEFGLFHADLSDGKQAKHLSPNPIIDF